MATIFTEIMPAKVNGVSAKSASRAASAASKRKAVHRDALSVAGDASFEVDAQGVLGPLQLSLAGVLASLPGPLDRSTDLQHLLKSDPKLAWQIFKFVQAPAVLPASSSLPGAVAMRRFLKLSGKKGADKAALAAALDAFTAFESFVRSRAGDRRSFNTMAGGGRNDGQATNLAHKKAAFRAAAHFLGVQTDVIALTFLLHPSKRHAGKWDLATLVYKIGIRRLRPDSRIMLAHVGKSTPGESGEANFFEPIEPNVDPGFVATLLPPFCSNADADTVITHERDEYVEMEIAAGSVGTAGSTNWAFGVVERNADVTPFAGHSVQFRADISAAVQTLVVDIFVANDDAIEPASAVKTYLISRMPSIRNDGERLNLNETVLSIGRGDVAVQRAELLRHGELVRYACGRLDWNPASFRAYRCRVDYPVLGSAIDINLSFPPRSSVTK